jgi:AraC family transcriptional regulator
MQSPEHGHDALSLSMVLGGSVVEDVGAVRVVGEPLHAVVKPPATLHANRFGRAGALLIQVLPAEDVVCRMRETGAGFGCWHWTDTAHPAPWVALARALIDDVDEDTLADRVAEAIGGVVPTRRMDRAGARPAWLRRVRERLLETHAEPVSLQDLATEHGVHRVHLARAFREHFGVTPSEFRLRRRVGVAVGFLAGDAAGSHADSPLAGVAARARFADQAHMTREFGRWLGLTPRRYVDLVRQNHAGRGR